MTLQQLPNTAYIHAADPGEQGYPGNPARVSVTAADVVFIDGLHTETAVRDDILLASQVLRSPGLIILHDMHLEAVQKAVRVIGLEAAVVNTEFGLGVIRV